MQQPALERVFIQTGDPVLVVDEGGLVQFANPAALQLFKVPAQAGTPLANIIGGLSTNEIMHTPGFGLKLLKIETHNGTREFTCMSVETGALAPGESMLLLFFKAGAHVVQHEGKRALDLITHDLKNPLGALFGYADVLLDTAAGQNMSAAQRTIISRIRSTAARAIELVRNYQFLGAPAGMARSTGKGCDLNNVTAQLVDTMWREEQNAPTLTFEGAKSELPVKIERLALERVVSNLLGNAIKYTPPGGQIELRTAIEGSKKILTVRNSGSFIPPEEQPAIFEIYARGSSSKGTAGSGLGLHIVRQIVESAGGTIDVQSTREHGTTFTVRLD